MNDALKSDLVPGQPTVLTEEQRYTDGSVYRSTFLVPPGAKGETGEVPAKISGTSLTLDGAMNTTLFAGLRQDTVTSDPYGVVSFLNSAGKWQELILTPQGTLLAANAKPFLTCATDPDQQTAVQRFLVPQAVNAQTIPFPVAFDDDNVILQLTARNLLKDGTYYPPQISYNSVSRFNFNLALFFRDAGLWGGPGTDLMVTAYGKLAA